MKEVLLKLEDSLLFLEKVNKDTYLAKNKNKYSIDVIEKGAKINYDEGQDELEHDLYNVLSSYLLEREIIKELNKNNDKNKKILDKMSKRILGDLYYSVLSNLELERYFHSNNTLVEKAFIDFNLTGLKDELKEIYKIIKREEYDDNFIKKVQANWMENGINIKDYEELELFYNEEGMLILSNENGEEIRPDNINDKYSIEITANYSDPWLYDILFCSMICLFFCTKVLYISEDNLDIYEELSGNDMLKERGLKLVLYND